MAKRKTSAEEYKRKLYQVAAASKSKHPEFNPNWIESVHYALADMSLLQIRWAMQGVRQSFVAEASQPTFGNILRWALREGIPEEAVKEFIVSEVVPSLMPLIHETTGHAAGKVIIGEMGQPPTHVFEYEEDPRDVIRQVMEHILNHGEMPEKVFTVTSDGQVMEGINPFHPGRKVKPEDMN